MTEPAFVEGHNRGDPMVLIRKARSETELLVSFYYLSRHQSPVLALDQGKAQLRNSIPRKNEHKEDPSEHKHTMSDSVESPAVQVPRNEAKIEDVLHLTKSRLKDKFNTTVTEEYLQQCIEALTETGYFDIGTL